MSKIKVTNILLSDQPSGFLTPFRIEIFIESSALLLEKLEWKIIYVGSAESSNYDQVLDDIMVPIEDVGPVSFELLVDPPNPALIPSMNDLLGPSVLMISALYKSSEFFRVSYFVYNNYVEEVPGGLNESNFDINKVFRCVLTDKPRIKLNDIDWNDEQDKYYADKINLHNDEDITRVKQETVDIFNQFQDPFGFSENSFLGNKLFNN
jgi:histone chaperone ASF1